MSDGMNQLCDNNFFQASHVHFSVFVLWFGLGGLCISTGAHVQLITHSATHPYPPHLSHSSDIPIAGGIAYEGVTPFQVLPFSPKKTIYQV